MKNVLSLFDGLSCGQLALNRAGIEYDNYYASEVDENAIKVTQQHFKNTKQIGDICEIKCSDLPVIDLLIGGSPCQSFSRGGDGSGFDGKSKLFWEFIRVLNEAKEINPQVYFFLENVVMKKEWRDIISEAIGVEPIEVDSKLVSAQKRQRLYWTNIEGFEMPKDRNIKTIDILDDDPTWVDPDELLWKDEESGEWRVRNATKLGYLVVNNFDAVNLDFPKSKTRRGRVAKQKVNTLNTGCNQGIFVAGKIKRLSQRECERLQTLPDFYTQILSDSKARHAIGNGWTVDIIVEFFKNIK